LKEQLEECFWKMYKALDTLDIKWWWEEEKKTAPHKRTLAHGSFQKPPHALLSPSQTTLP